jgi:hypothetical protein
MLPGISLDKRRKRITGEERRFMQPVTNANRLLAPKLCGVAFVYSVKDWMLLHLMASPPKRDFPCDEKNILVAPDDNQHL